MIHGIEKEEIRGEKFMYPQLFISQANGTSKRYASHFGKNPGYFQRQELGRATRNERVDEIFHQLELENVRNIYFFIF